MKTNTIYWTAQVSGWLIYTVLAGLVNQLDGNPMNASLAINLTAACVLGIVISHLLRLFIIQFGWLKLNVAQIIPRALPAILVAGIVFHALHSSIIILATNQPVSAFDTSLQVQRVLGWSSLFFIWAVLYFTYHYFQNYRLQEIKNLRLEAANVESELKNLKSQLNPHFMFNAMNSIRALVDENPIKAKQSITQLSNILRNSLITGKKKEITFAEELGLVKDYLALEQTRYEERLTVEYNIEDSIKNCKIPPMLIQTLAENAIKHGISKLPNGGTICIDANILDEKINVSIRNSGNLKNSIKPETGIGIANTKQRLELLYGEQASFTIKEIENNSVVATVILPKN